MRISWTGGQHHQQQDEDAVPHFWHCAGMVADSGQLVEHEFTGVTGLNPLVWFEMVWLNHSSRIIFIMSLIIVIVLLLRYMVIGHAIFRKI